MRISRMEVMLVETLLLAVVSLDSVVFAAVVVETQARMQDPAHPQMHEVIGPSVGSWAAGTS